MSDPTSESANFSDSVPELFQLSGLIDKVTETARRAHEARVTGIARGAKTNLELVDREFCGALPVGIISLNGGSGAGKTGLGMQTASDCGCPAIFASCEMAADELFLRSVARINECYLNRYKSGEMPPETVRAHAIKAAAAAPMLAIADLTRAVAMPRQDPCTYLYEVATILRRRHADEGQSDSTSQEHAPFLLVIDSLHSWAMRAASANPKLSSASETEVLIYALDALNQLAHALQCPILLITERNRASMDKGGLNAGAGTRRIEYGAGAVLSLDVARDAKGEPMRANAAGEKRVFLTFAKNRHGSAGKKVELLFNGALMRFREP